MAQKIEWHKAFWFDALAYSDQQQMSAGQHQHDVAYGYLSVKELPASVFIDSAMTLHM